LIEHITKATVTNLEVTPTSQYPFLYCIISCGTDTLKGALSKGKHISMDSRLRSEDPTHCTNYHRTNWSKLPSLDLLMILNLVTNKTSQDWMTEWGWPARGKELASLPWIQVIASHQGKRFKGWCKVIKGKGYDIYIWNLQATECGASIWSRYLGTFCFSYRPYSLSLLSYIPVRFLDHAETWSGYMIHGHSTSQVPWYMHVLILYKKIVRTHYMDNQCTTGIDLFVA